jgi:hypothetical protein
MQGSKKSSLFIILRKKYFIAPDANFAALQMPERRDGQWIQQSLCSKHCCALADGCVNPLVLCSLANAITKAIIRFVLLGNAILVIAIRNHGNYKHKLVFNGMAKEIRLQR